MFKKLLVPLDGSSLAEQALGTAAAIARASHAAIDVVRVHDVSFNGLDVVAPEMSGLLEEEVYASQTARELASGAGLPVTSAVVEGIPLDAICDRIHEVNADLVVMTTHGRTGLRRAVMGSVADGITRRSSVPVLMLRPIEGKRDRLAAHHLPKRIVVPLDGSAELAAILAPAAALAKCSGASITLVRIVPPVPLALTDAGVPFAYPYPVLVPDDAATRGLVEDAKRDLAATARNLTADNGIHVGADVIIETRTGAAIVDFAKALDADLIAMATHGRGASRLLFGSVADKVLRSSHVSLLVVRPVRAQAIPTESLQTNDVVLGTIT